jgi:hypothetical protein
MANRSCPLCFVKLSRTAVLARSDDLICPSCRSELELSRHSRVEAAFFGVLVAYAAIQLAALTIPKVAWVAGVAVAVVVFGAASVAFLYFLSDLTLRPKVSGAPFPQTHG